MSIDGITDVFGLGPFKPQLLPNGKIPFPESFGDYTKSKASRKLMPTFLKSYALENMTSDEYYTNISSYNEIRKDIAKLSNDAKLKLDLMIGYNDYAEKWVDRTYKYWELYYIIPYICDFSRIGLAIQNHFRAFMFFDIELHRLYIKISNHQKKCKIEGQYKLDESYVIKFKNFLGSRLEEKFDTESLAKRKRED